METNPKPSVIPRDISNNPSSNLEGGKVIKPQVITKPKPIVVENGKVTPKTPKQTEYEKSLEKSGMSPAQAKIAISIEREF